MVCSHCHSENPVGNGFCGKCGTALSESPYVAPRYERRESVVRREIAILACGVLGIIAAVVIGWYLVSYQRSPALVVRHFIEADRAGAFQEEERYVSTRWDSQMILSLLQNVRQSAGQSP